MEVRDAWQKKDLGPRTSVSIELPAHGSALLRLVIKPVPRGLFKGEAFAIPGKIEMEDFDINGLGQGNTTYNELDSENHSCTDEGKEAECTNYREGTGVDLYKKASGNIVVGHNRAGEWLEYTVNVKKGGDYVMLASVATDNSTAGFSLSVDGKTVAEVPVSGESWNDFADVKSNVKLSEGEHILRFTITGDWFDIDYVRFCATETCEDLASIRDMASRERFAVPAAASGKVFSLTGRYLGNVDLGASAAAQDISASLEQAGFARGVYMVRLLGKTIRVDVKK